MLKREWHAESNGKLLHLSIPGKTLILAPEIAVEDLPLEELQPWFLRSQWETCFWAEHYDDDDDHTVGQTFVSLCRSVVPPGIETCLSPNRALHFPRRHSFLEFRLEGRSSVAPMHWLLLGFWVNVCKSRFITCDDPTLKFYSIIMVPLQKCQCWLHALWFVFWCQLISSVLSKHNHRPHFIVGGSSNNNLHFQPLQWCYFENSGSPASALLYHYTQSLHAMNGLLAVGRVRNLLCGCPLY